MECVLLVVTEVATTLKNVDGTEATVLLPEGLREIRVDYILVPL